ncbi:hypothetical protein D3C85_1478680 [compost metagenome]
MTAVGEHVQLGLVMQCQFHAQGAGGGQFVVLAGGDQDRHLELAHLLQAVPVLEVADIEEFVGPLHGGVGAHVPVAQRAFDRRRPLVEAAHVTVVEQGDGCLVLGMIEVPLGLVALHHRHGFAAQGTAQAFQLADQVRDVADGVFQN